MRALSLLASAAFMFFLAAGCGQSSESPSSADAFRGRTIVVDVRTPEEWTTDGHAPCSVNYPLDNLENYLDTLKSYDNVVVVCRSGKRAGKAKQILENAGIKNVKNKGGWTNIHCRE